MKKMGDPLRKTGEIEVKIPTNNQVKKKIIFLTEEHQLIKKWMDEKNG
jgi:hypothetical protein